MHDIVLVVNTQWIIPLKICKEGRLHGKCSYGNRIKLKQFYSDTLIVLFKLWIHLELLKSWNDDLTI